MTEEEFKQELYNIDINITEEQLLLFRKYKDFLLEYNKHTNLTAIRDENGVYLKHFYDSLLLLKYQTITSENILDIGTGAGFPSIPLKIMRPDIELTLLEANGKKVKFLNELKSILNIDYTVIQDRAEVYIKNKREYFDIVLSRAVASMPVLSELSLPYVKVGGLFIPYKGQIDETIENGEYAIATLGGEVIYIKSAILPKENSVRNFIFVQKKCQTDSKFPRLFDKINKKPLQK